MNGKHVSQTGEGTRVFKVFFELRTFCGVEFDDLLMSTYKFVRKWAVTILFRHSAEKNLEIMAF